MKLKTTKWDIQDHLKTEEDIAAYLEAAAEENDPEFLAVALGDVARARGMSEVAKKTGMTRQGLYDAFSKGGNPSLATVASVAKVFNMKVALVPRSIEEEIPVQLLAGEGKFKNMPKKTETSLRGRNAKTGEFMKVSEARQRPATTVVERVPLPGKGRK